ncbi:hypothetical protein M9H77_22805 [Catharanthus roseus]|uniref:Uncharacterized protein n=1 Tax=Catharanthus roseus TaxID=4058 RepID=A0ACC0AU23_CATRO|nr:hypothetical protein M9H77_22805 [Catharanthus roseus]
MDWLQSCTLPFRACKFAKPFLFLSTSSLLDADFGPSIYAVSSDKSSSLLSRRTKWSQSQMHGRTFAAPHILKIKSEILQKMLSVLRRIHSSVATLEDIDPETFEEFIKTEKDKKTIYNARTKMKKKRMERRNTVEEVLHQCNQQGYRCYWRNCGENNIRNDIVVVNPVSILIITT